MTHAMLGECDESQITYELETSRKIIEDKIGGPVKYLSLPFGSSNDRVITLAKQLGYQGIFTSLSNVGKRKNELCQFGRIHVKDTYPLRKFMRLIDPNPTQFFLTRADQALKGIIKEIIGLNNYRKLYRFMYRIEL
jgi:peptidoglycan/xylan/chitin deacetylase (PgdA/CDA1 family)